MTDRFPDYDVLAKKDGQSWNDRTRSVIAERLALTVDETVLGPTRTATLCAIVDRIVPQPESRPPVNAAALVIEKIANDAGDGYRPEGFPHIRQAWTIGLDAIDEEAKAKRGCSFAQLSGDDADVLLRSVENGEARHKVWGDMSSKSFWDWRLLSDIVAAYFSHPSAWSMMGFGGPAAPRGYVRLETNRRDGWEAAEKDDGRLLGAAARNRHVR